MEENDIANILWEQDPKNPFFDLQIFEIPKHNFDPVTPLNFIKSKTDKVKHKFIMGHLNARSLNKNIIELRELIENADFDAFSVSESWLRSRTPKDRFLINGYNIFRSDRRNRRGGGVCCYVRENYLAKKIKIPNIPTNPEFLFVEVSVLHQKLAIGTFYKAPNIPCKVFHEAFDSLVYIFNRYEQPILTGDFNVNCLTPESSNFKTLSSSIIEPFNLTQIIDQPTRITETSSTLIDLFLVKNPEKVISHGACAVPGISDHHLIFMAYDIKKPKFKPLKVTARNFKNFDMEAFLAAAELANFENIYNVVNVNDKVTILENTINDLLDIFAPYKTFTVTKQNSTPWLTDNIREVMDLRDMYKYNFNKTGNTDFEKKYKQLKNKVTGMMRHSQKTYFNDTINNKVKDSKDFFRTAKKLNLISDKSNRGKINFSAEQLNKTFLENNNAIIDSDFINAKLQELYNKTSPCIHKFSFQDVTEHDVVKVVKTIKSMSVGVDEINIFVVKSLIHRISDVLAHIVNVSFETGIFPDRWKKAIIKPIPKVTVPILPSEYRPISLLPALSKIIEKLANRQIVYYLIKHDLLDPYQSAYQKRHSTQTALLRLTEDIYDAIDDSEITLLVFLDFSKAFDTVNHELLLAKLQILGFQETTCDWVRSYLSDRHQKVVTASESSNWSPIINGVPQGSILGPLLFTILISDMRMSIWSGSYVSYADDTNLYWESAVETINETITAANSVTSKISTYCTDNCLRLNPGKCKYMFIGTKPGINKLNSMVLGDLKINNVNMERVTHAKLLGVTFDEVLSWIKQVNKCIGMAMSNFFQINRYKRFLNRESKIILCESIVLSQFNYCDIVYASMDKYLKEKIQKVQNLCLRFIFDIKKKVHPNYDILRKELKWLNMDSRRLKHGLTLIYKIVHDLAPNYLRDSFSLVSEIHTRNTRSSNSNIWIKNSIKSKLHRNSYSFHMVKIYNSLPEDIKNSVSVNSFKTRIGKLLHENLLAYP